MKLQRQLLQVSESLQPAKKALERMWRETEDDVLLESLDRALTHLKALEEEVAFCGHLEAMQHTIPAAWTEGK